jgi:Anti-sigma-28 factor, FlgM
MKGQQRRAPHQRRSEEAAVSDPSTRAMRITTLKERIARSDYTVDPHAVAEAILRRAAAQGTTLPLPPVSRADARSRPASAPRRAT